MKLDIAKFTNEIVYEDAKWVALAYEGTKSYIQRNQNQAWYLSRYEYTCPIIVYNKINEDGAVVALCTELHVCGKPVSHNSDGIVWAQNKAMRFANENDKSLIKKVVCGMANQRTKKMHQSKRMQWYKKLEEMGFRSYDIARDLDALKYGTDREWIVKYAEIVDYRLNWNNQAKTFINSENCRKEKCDIVNIGAHTQYLGFAHFDRNGYVTIHKTIQDPNKEPWVAFSTYYDLILTDWDNYLIVEKQYGAEKYFIKDQTKVKQLTLIDQQIMLALFTIEMQKDEQNGGNK